MAGAGSDYQKVGVYEERRQRKLAIEAIEKNVRRAAGRVQRRVAAKTRKWSYQVPRK